MRERAFHLPFVIWIACGAIAGLAILVMVELALDTAAMLGLVPGDVGANCDDACATGSGGAAGGAMGGGGRDNRDRAETEWDQERRRREELRTRSTDAPGLRESREGPGGHIGGAPDRGTYNDPTFPAITTPTPPPPTFREFLDNDPGYRRFVGGGER